MRKLVITAVTALVIGIVGGWLLFHKPGVQSDGKERKILYYRDPMNPENTSPVPKKAPDGMDYVPVYEEQSGSSADKKIAYWKDPMHPWYTSDRPGKAPDCGMDLVPVYEGEAATKGIRIDPTVEQNIGVKTEKVLKRKISREIRTVGKVDFNETKVFSVNTKIMGWVEHLYVDYTGQPVRKGQPLLDIYSPDLMTTQEEYLQALRYRNSLAESNSPDARAGAENLLESARRRLLNWDIPEKEIQALEERGTPRKTMTIDAPVGGFVMEKMVQQGQNVMAGMELYKIADISTVWIIAEVFQYELPWVRVGEKADIELSYLPGKSFSGRVSYIYPMLNMETKTARVRIEIRNTPEFQIKPEMFATVKIASPLKIESLAVPEQSVIHSGERTIVVVALGGGYFDPREVTLGVDGEGYVQVLKGLHEGESIVTSSQFLIDSESNLKAALNQMSARGGAASPSTGGGPASSGMTEEKKESPVNESRGRGGTKESRKAKKNDRQPGQDHGGMEGMKMDAQQPSNRENVVPDTSGRAAEAVDSIDPVCGMNTDPGGKYSFVYEGKTYYFCSEGDMNKFKGNPQKYANAHKGH